VVGNLAGFGGVGDFFEDDVVGVVAVVFEDLGGGVVGISALGEGVEDLAEVGGIEDYCDFRHCVFRNRIGHGECSLEVALGHAKIACLLGGRVVDRGSWVGL
jgi:hypothetical protein